MLLKGYYIKGTESYELMVLKHQSVWKILLGLNGTVVSAYQNLNGVEYCAYNKEAKNLYSYIKRGIEGCTAKNGSPTLCKFGAASVHHFKKTKAEYSVSLYKNELAGITVNNEDISISAFGEAEITDIDTSGVSWVQIGQPVTRAVTGKATGDTESEFRVADDVVDVPVRTLQEIALEKDITWLKDKNYYIVNNEQVAEQLFSVFENWKGSVSYDTETSGLRINMFGKIGSKEKADIEKWNAEHPDNQYRVDYLVGIILCVEEGTSYYFPVKNRKFKNLYNDVNDPITRAVCERIKADYMIGKYRDRVDDMARFIRETPIEKWTSDVILMERVRPILETRDLCAHHGTFEWMVSWLYNIIINLVDDTMILHQLMYKFRSTTSNRGEPSNLKYLSLREFGINQLDLEDFFVGYKEDDSGKAKAKGKGRGKKKSSNIDFSYMDYEGARAYAPADGDLTLGLLRKYKTDLIENNQEMVYLYNVEVIVACAIGYMEFYGHRLDEEKIEQTRKENIVKMAHIENKIREMNSLRNPTEIALYNKLLEYDKAKSDAAQSAKDCKGNGDKVGFQKYNEESSKYNEAAYDIALKLREEIDKQGNLSISAPNQVADLLYGKYNFKLTEDGKKSVAKNVLKQYMNLKDESGSPKYPEVNLYQDWKKLFTLDTKFFGNLQDFMYPGGYIFSSYGQISTATGRMSCSKPNAQQYPKAITSIVIPRKDCVHVDSDYSQIEYRTLVGMAQELELLKQFFDPDMDYHTMMAALMYGVLYALVTKQMRSDAKSFNFGIPYGMGFKSLAILLTGSKGDKEVEEAKQKYELYFKNQPKVKKFFQDVKESAEIYQYTKTWFGRRRYYSFTDKNGNFSNKYKAAALRQAGNAVIQGTAADIFKIGVARVFLWIRDNNLLGKVFLINMVHDEMLFEVNTKEVNALWAVANILECMQLHIDGFPPLYAGAGVSSTWSKAKDKPAEIHPLLGARFIEEAKNGACVMGEPEEVIEYFKKRNTDFRIEKITNYLLDTKNHGQVLDPIIGSILGIEFDYGAEDEFKKYAKENSLDKHQEEELMKALPIERLKRFIEDKKIDIDWRLFATTGELHERDAIEDEGYDDEDDEEGAEPDEILESDFALLDEDETLFGVNLIDLIKEFGMVISKSHAVVGIDITCMSFNKKEEMIEYINQHVCDALEPEALEVVFLKENRVLFRTGIYVKGIDGSVLNTKLRINTVLNR